MINVKKLKTVLFISLLFIVPMALLALIFYGRIMIINAIDRYDEGNEDYQRNYIMSFAEDDVFTFDYIFGDDIYCYNYSDSQNAKFKIEDSVFGEYYFVEYYKGQINEVPNINFAENHDFTDSTDFINSVFGMELHISEFDMKLRYNDNLLEEQNSMRVVCDLKGESKLVLNFKYRNEIITINDLTVEYIYYLNKDSNEYDSNNVLHILIKFTYNDTDCYLYCSKKS